MRVIVTRPAREALVWAGALRERGLVASVLPLIDIGPAADQSAVREAWARLKVVDAVMFVSANAVEFFFGAVAGASSWPTVRAWATGPGTAKALLASGVPASLIDAPSADAPQFDSEALWQVIGPQVTPDARILIVRGSDAQGRDIGRDWLASQLVSAGAQVQALVAYQRMAPKWSADQLAQAREAASGESVWLFSSSQAIANLQGLLPDASWHRARAVATHPRIAAAAEQAGFGVVCPSRPSLTQVVASIESMR